MKRFHQIFGILILLIFLFTGQYMQIYHNHLRDMPDGLRLLFRSRHIYILLAGLINVGIGAYLTKRESLWRQRLQWSGSVFITIATLLLITAFFYEPGHTPLGSPLSNWGIYAIAAGTMFHLFSGIGVRKN